MTKSWYRRVVFFVFLAGLFIAAPLRATEYRSVLELWDQVKPPATVEIKAVKVTPAETAFLILDIEERTCNPKARPRCLETVPRIQAFLEKSRASGMLVAYSLTAVGTPETILSPVIPRAGEPIVKSSVDKFFQTELEKILREGKIKTVIIAGTAAEGAVLHTATGAAVRGFQVIVPVDGMSSSSLFAEQYTAWHMLNAPGTRQRATLTRFVDIAF